jgi:hypothetical protein
VEIPYMATSKKNPTGEGGEGTQTTGGEGAKTTGSSGNRRTKRMTLGGRVQALVQAENRKIIRLADQLRQAARGG